jgi:hypothetical protein
MKLNSTVPRGEYDLEMAAMKTRLASVESGNVQFLTRVMALEMELQKIKERKL